MGGMGVYLAAPFFCVGCSVIEGIIFRMDANSSWLVLRNLPLLLCYRVSWFVLVASFIVLKKT